MNVIQTRAEVGDDHMLHVRLPEDIPAGEVEVLLVVEPANRPRSAEERWAAAEAGRGALAHLNLSVEEFLAERRADEARREKVLGL